LILGLELNRRCWFHGHPAAGSSPRFYASRDKTRRDSGFEPHEHLDDIGEPFAIAAADPGRHNSVPRRARPPRRLRSARVIHTGV